MDAVNLLRGSAAPIALGGANRDPEGFPDPPWVMIDRTNASAQLAFSQGVHHCLGAALARLEGRVVFVELTRR